jgi:hypothetical protein
MWSRCTARMVASFARLTGESDRFPGPLFPFSLGVLGTRRVDDQTKSSHTKCVLVGRCRRAVVFHCTVAVPWVRWQQCGYEVRPPGVDRAFPACGLLLWSCVGSR